MRPMSQKDLYNLSERIFERYEEKTMRKMYRKTYINPTEFARETMDLRIFYYKLSYDYIFFL